jgi:hypothetical protein
VARGLEFQIAYAMTQRNLEVAIGRLVTDEDARRSLRESPAGFVLELRASGLAFSPAEEAALLAIDTGACERFARTLDPRVQKVSLLPTARVRPGRTRG